MVRGKSAVSPNGIPVGYARVSTEDQNLDMQIAALKRAGVHDDNIHVDYGSGSNVKRRKGLQLALKDCREGDTLTVWKLDRLTRYMPDLYWILGELDRKGVALHSLTEHIDTSTASGRLGMNMATAFAQYERETIAERTKAGLDRIRELRGKGFKWGPTPKMTEAKLKRAERLLNEKGLSGPKVAAILKVKPPTIYHYFKSKKRKDGTVQFIRKTKPK